MPNPPFIKTVLFESNADPNYNGNKVVTADMSDGTHQRVFYFYDDELSFRSSELLGLTLDEACELKRKKDVAYLQS
jgi:hypothetical protein